MKVLKKITIFGVASTLIAGVILAAPAQAATKDLVVGSTTDIDKLDPQGATSFSTFRVLGLVYGSLVEAGPKLQIAPGLAKSWAFNSTGDKLTLKLRSGVKFHDGSTFDANDVKASLLRILDPVNNAAARANIETIKSITASGLTVTLNLTQPNAPILSALVGINMAMLSSQDITDGKIGKTVNGTGPFKFLSWDAGQTVKLKKNATYWDGAPKLDTVTFRVIPTEASILAALNAGTVQFAVIEQPLIAKQVHSNLKLYKTPSLAYMVLQINAKKAPFDNLNVRLAMQCAISRAEVIKTAAAGEGAVIGPINSSAYLSDVKARPCPTVDLKKAKAYLTAAGYPDGLTIKTMVSPDQFATAAGIGQSLKSQLAKAGITMELDTVDSSTFVNRWLAADFGSTIANNGGDEFDPDQMYTRYFTSGGNFNSVAGYSSASLDALFAKGKSSTSPSTRTAVYKAITAELENNAVWIWLYSPYEYRITSKKLTGFIPLATGSLIELRKADLK